MERHAYNIQVLRGGYDCSNGGLSSTNDTFLAVTDEERGEELAKEPNRKIPILVLENHVPNAVRLRPLKSQYPGGGHVGPMFGSQYAKGDSSFGEAVARVLGSKIRMYDPVAIHDRFESQELNDMMSR